MGYYSQLADTCSLISKTMMQRFGLIGFPLSHSFSKGYFTQKFEKENLPFCQYDNFPIENIELLQDILAKNPELCGLNVTIPYKEKVIPFLHGISSEAQEIGAVNTIKIRKKENQFYLEGFNTDVFGFSESLRPLLKPWHQKALVLGTGGASKAVCYALDKLGISPLLISRNKGLTYEALDKAILEQHPLIINTTPLGTFPKVEECPPLPYSWLTPRHLLYDLVYNPAETAFLKEGLLRGCQIKNGLEMLHLQAEKAWHIWNHE